MVLTSGICISKAEMMMRMMKSPAMMKSMCIGGGTTHVSVGLPTLSFDFLSASHLSAMLHTAAFVITLYVFIFVFVFEFVSVF